MSNRISYYSLSQLFIQCEDQTEKSIFLEENKENYFINLNIDINIKKKNYEGKKGPINLYKNKILKFANF